MAGLAGTFPGQWNIRHQLSVWSFMSAAGFRRGGTSSLERDTGSDLRSCLSDFPYFTSEGVALHGENPVGLTPSIRLSEL